MKKQPLYFNFDHFSISSQSSAFWVAQPNGRRWVVISPASEELGSIYDDGNAYFVTCEQLGIRMVQRKTVQDCVYVIAFALYCQHELQRRQEQ
jgi:hypothetical protein